MGYIKTNLLFISFVVGTLLLSACNSSKDSPTSLGPDSTNQTPDTNSTEGESESSTSELKISVEELFRSESQPIRTVRNRFTIDDYDGDGIKDIYRKEDYWITVTSGDSGELLTRFEYSGLPKTPEGITRYVVDSIYVGGDYFVKNDASEDIFVYSISSNQHIEIGDRDWQNINTNSMVRLGFWNADDLLDFGIVVNDEVGNPDRFLIFDVQGNRLAEYTAHDLLPGATDIKVWSWTGGSVNGLSFDIVLNFSGGTAGGTFLFENADLRNSKPLSDHYRLFALPDRNEDDHSEYAYLTYPGGVTTLNVLDGVSLTKISSFKLPSFSSNTSSSSIITDNLNYDFVNNNMPILGDVDGDGIADHLMKVMYEDSNTNQSRPTSLVVSGADFSEIGPVDGLSLSFYSLQDIDGDDVSEVLVNDVVYRLVFTY